MGFNFEELVLSLVIIKESDRPPQAALKLADKEGLALEKVFDCGRTNGIPGSIDMKGEQAFDSLKKALREMLEKLES